MTTKATLRRGRFFLFVLLAAAAVLLFRGVQAEDAGRADLKIELLNARPLSKEQAALTVIQLTHMPERIPVFAEEIETVHEKPMHALIIDPRLSDYAHQHPVAMQKPGLYAFFMRPKTDCNYRVWIEFTLNGDRGTHQMMIERPGREKCSTADIDRTPRDLYESPDGYKFTLKSDAALTAGKRAKLTLDITDNEGRPVDALVPLMGAYAHLAGFYDDFNTVAHIHPLQEVPHKSREPGAAPLGFHFQPVRPGFIKFYAQVIIGGKTYFAPFGMIIAPAAG